MAVLHVVRSPVLTVALTVLFLTGCRKVPPENGFGIGPRDDPVLRVAVENQNFLDVTVYLRGDSGASWRLGEVTGNSNRTFTVDRRQLAAHPGFRLFVDPLGAREAYLSELVFPDRAAQVVLCVAAHLEQSYVILR